MQLLVGSEIAEQIARQEPERVAVAYLGKDWRQFLKTPNALKSVIVSPTLGTNPDAVIDLVNALGEGEDGWEKVHFLESLHAKIYWSARGAVVGSANLSRNGLSGEHLRECCLGTQDAVILTQLAAYLDSLEEQARTAFANTEAKKIQLMKLRDLWNRAVANGVVKHPRSAPPAIATFRFLDQDDFYVIWWNDDRDMNYREDAQDMAGRMMKESQVLPDDQVREGRFVLTWRVNRNGTCRKSSLDWMYIDKIVPDAIEPDADYPYSKTLWQLTPDDRLPPPPFELTEQVCERFCLAMKTLGPSFSPQGGNLWKLAEGQARLKDLMNYLQTA